MPRPPFKLSALDLRAMLDSDDPGDRSRALAFVATRRLSEHRSRCQELMLDDPDPKLREKAAWALDNISDPRTFPALVRTIHDPEFSVRSAAGWALVHLDDERVRPEMERIQHESEDEGARHMALLVLQNLDARGDERDEIWKYLPSARPALRGLG